jgi:hypothetical protein
MCSHYPIDNRMHGHSLVVLTVLGKQMFQVGCSEPGAHVHLTRGIRTDMAGQEWAST